MAAVIGLFGCAGSDSTSSALAGGKDTDPAFSCLVCWLDADPMPLGEERDTSPLGSGWCCQVTLSAIVRDSTALVTSACPIYIFPTSNRLQKTLFVEKNEWLKKRLFFIIEDFLGILNRLCAKPTRRSHDFLSLTLAIVGSTSNRCYFLQQYQCLLVCIFCVLVVSCVKSEVGESEKIWYILL